MSEGGRCSACGGGSDMSVHLAREMMLGTGDEFSYLECGGCGALTLQDPPSSLSPYYPAGYYSFDGAAGDSRSGPTGAAARAVLGHAVLRPAFARLARVAQARLGNLPAWFLLLAACGVTAEAAVLDVGCGSGHRLRSLRRWGFRSLTGADPYVPPGTELGDGIGFLALAAEDVVGRYDVVMFHHSLEHTADAGSALHAARGVLRRGGVVVVRIPLADSFAWRRYRSHWVQLDAPRHFLVPTVRAVHRLAERTGFVVAATVHDSDAFQFWGSEQYRRGIPLTGPRSHLVDPEQSPFGAAALREYGRRARRLNAIADGDQAAFLLRAA